MYFESCTTIEDLKKEYRRLALEFHPDKGGDTIIMQAINTEYEMKLRELAQRSETAENDIEAGLRYKEQIDKIIDFDVNIELCGTWIWVSGNTYPVKEELKEAGFFWARKKQQWYWRPPEYKRKSKKTMSMDWIRNTYGSVIIENQHQEVRAIA
jgi:hypothetical protein